MTNEPQTSKTKGQSLVQSHGPRGERRAQASANVERRTVTAWDRERALTQSMMEEVCKPDNLNQAYKRVKANKGAPGIDRMTVGDLRPWIAQHKEELIQSLLEGTYQPKPVRGVEIPKPGGGVRQLGIPTVVDRLIQQAMLQILDPILDPTFSPSSYGFRPKRSAHDALKQAQEFVRDGNMVVVDLDLEKFFDRVNHDILMSRLARRIGDKRFLRIIRRFLEVGLMKDGVCVTREEGTPQGGPLSPILANLLLDDLDKELERRGHKFCRYADDCNIYVRSQAAGERVMQSVSRFLEHKLRLRVNQAKSAVAPTTERKFLGHRLLRGGRLGIAPQSLERVKSKIRQLTLRSRGRSLGTVIDELNEFLSGWVVYYRYAVAQTHLTHLDEWIHRKLRCYRLKQCKTPSAIASLLMPSGAEPSLVRSVAACGRRWWWLSNNKLANQAMGHRWFQKKGLINLVHRWKAAQSS